MPRSDSEEKKEEETLEEAEETPELTPMEPIEETTEPDNEASEDTSDLEKQAPQEATEPVAEEAPVVETEPTAEPEVEAEEEPSEELTPEVEPVEDTPAEAPAAPKPKKKKGVEEVKIVLDHDPKEELDKDLAGNRMREVIIEKVVVNIGVGEAGDKLQRAERVLKILTGHEPSRTLSRTTNRDFGVRKHMPIGCRVTLRDEDAQQFLKDAFWVKENRLAGYSFDREGNFSFGIPDYTSFPNQKYDPDIGIFGMDISVTLTRAGKRIKRRKHAKGKIPHRHRLTSEVVKDYLRVNYNIEVVEE